MNASKNSPVQTTTVVTISTMSITQSDEEEESKLLHGEVGDDGKIRHEPGWGPEMMKCNCIGDWQCIIHRDHQMLPSLEYQANNSCYYCGRDNMSCQCHNIGDGSVNHIMSLGTSYCMLPDDALQAEFGQSEQAQRFQKRKEKCDKYKVEMYDDDESESEYSSADRKYMLYYWHRIPFMLFNERKQGKTTQKPQTNQSTNNASKSK